MQNLTSISQSSSGNLTIAPGKTLKLSGTLSPSTSDGAALGSTSLMWSDLFLASGGVINFNNGDVTLTHSSNTLTLGGGGLTVDSGFNVLVTKGTLNVGAFSSATAGSGVALSATTTAAFRVYADDGGAKLTSGEKRTSISRFLFATADTDGTDQTMSAHVGQVKIANDLTIGGNLAGLCGYLEVATTKTLIGGRRAQMSVASALWARVDLPSGAIVGTSGIVSGLAISADLGGTHTGKCSMINIPNPSAGEWDYFLDFGSAPGAIVADTSNLPAAATHKIKCRIDSTEFYLIGVADF